MTHLATWNDALIVAVGTLMAVIVLEFATYYLAPAESDDPRLGTFAFWVWVGVTAVTSAILEPYWSRANVLVMRILWGVEFMAWLAWKFGLSTDDWSETQRAREQSWAMTVGMLLVAAKYVFLS